MAPDLTNGVMLSLSKHDATLGDLGVRAKTERYHWTMRRAAMA